ncbi:MAG: hypothetical protein C0602_00055 [Denitrovibrio sp.]|nr:MAG: hypothetical protein C0602_00055 [Denitrovibrio sp.]
MKEYIYKVTSEIIITSNEDLPKELLEDAERMSLPDTPSVKLLKMAFQAKDVEFAARVSKEEREVGD